MGFLSKTAHIFKKTPHQLVWLSRTRVATRELVNSGGSNGRGRGLKTVSNLLGEWTTKFAENSISEPKESIEIILGHCLNTSIGDIYKFQQQILPQNKLDEIEVLCRERLKRLPIQYVIGEWDFRGLTLKMSAPVFIPRPETEQLIDVVLREIDRKNVSHILDLCCGSGAISLSLLQERTEIKATAVDQSTAACRLTKENAQRNNLNSRIRIIQSQLDNLEYCERIDIIVANPPYIYTEDLSSLQPEIKLYEDLRALDGGRDGLDIIKIILKISSLLLNENGKLFLEVEPRHPSLICDYLEVNDVLGLACVETYKDFCGKERFVEITKH